MHRRDTSPGRLRRRMAVRALTALGLGAALALSTGAAAVQAAPSTSGTLGSDSRPGRYTNPLAPVVPGDGTVGSCADPTVFKGQAGDPYWYMYCTTDPLNDDDRTGGQLRFHKIPTSRSLDLVHWTYVGDAATTPPSWAEPNAAYWAPDVVYSSTFHQYYLFTVVTETADSASIPGCTGDSSIGVATSPSPTGPWTFSDAPVVAPRSNGGGCNFFWTFDPDVLGDVVGTSSTLYYGSYYGGIFGTGLTLTADGATASPDATMVAIDNRYEGANVIEKDGYYYLFVSATNCCNGALTAYSVFAGRSRSPLGPFVDREGQSLLQANVGGTPVLSMNGNRWTGTGHNTVFQDYSGQWWTIYHAVDRADPYFEGAVGFTRRPALLDPISWVDGWPVVNGGAFASDASRPAPAAQPGQRYRPERRPAFVQESAVPLRASSDEFSGTSLGAGWSWVRPPLTGTYSVGGGVLTWQTQAADLYVDSNNASVLTRPAPRGDYVVETRLTLDVPSTGCCFNYVQAGLVIYGSDDRFIKLADVSIWNTRQTEFAKETSPVPAGWARYGNTVVGPPSADGWTYLRIAVERLSGAARREALGDTERYTAYTSLDGEHWVRGGSWTHSLGPDARIGLVSMGGSGFTAQVDYVRTSTLRRSQLR